MVHFPKDSIEPNIPSEDTFLTPGHKLSHPKRKGKLIRAKEFVKD